MFVYLLIICVMNRLLYILLFAVLFSSCKEKKADNDWCKMNLHGKVKMIKEADYFLDTTGRDKGKKLRWTKVYVFNSSGKLSRIVELGEKGDTTLETKFVYDSIGRLRSEIKLSGRINDGGRVQVTAIYSYDSSNNIVAEELRAGTAPQKIETMGPTEFTSMKTKKSYNKLHQLTHQTILYLAGNDEFDSITTQYWYDKKGNKIKTRSINGEDIGVNTTFSYDEAGNCISEQMDASTDNGIVKITRLFDKENNTLEETSYEKGNVLRSKKNIEYLKPDKQGNWTAQRIHWHDLGTTVLERTIEYYP